MSESCKRLMCLIRKTENQPEKRNGLSGIDFCSLISNLNRPVLIFCSADNGGHREDALMLFSIEVSL